METYLSWNENIYGLGRSVPAIQLLRPPSRLAFPRPTVRCLVPRRWTEATQHSNAILRCKAIRLRSDSDPGASSAECVA